MNSKLWTLGLTVLACLLTSTPAGAQRGGATGTINTFVDVDGASTTFATVTGGMPLSGSDNDPSGASANSKVTITPLKVTVGLGEFADVIRSFLAGDGRAYALTVRYVDSSLAVLRSHSYTGCAVTELRFHKLDGASKERALVTIVFQPTSYKRGSTGDKLTVPSQGKVKATLSANYRVTMQGYDLTRVIEVGDIVVQKAAAAARGRETGNRILPFQLTLGTAALGEFDKRLDDLADGKAPPPVNAVVEWLSTDLKDTIFGIELQGVRLLTAEIQPSSDTRVSRSTLTLAAQSAKVVK